PNNIGDARGARLTRFRERKEPIMGFIFAVAACLLTTGTPGEEQPTVTWATLEARMKWEAEHGLAGVVLVAREGNIVFHQAYGLANREKKIVMRPDTILAIGSTPIDFTKAGILLLADRGKLGVNDSITKYLDSVPADKRSITIQHLM